MMLVLGIETWECRVGLCELIVVNICVSYYVHVSTADNIAVT
jgi:hypothetical protein